MSDLEALERQGWDALSGPSGAEFYEQNMLDEGVMVFPGMVMSKADAISTMRTVVPWSSYHLDDVRVIRAGSDVGLVIYRAAAVRENKPYEATMTSVYIRRDGEWRLLVHQQSP
jgi:hypothetical protein